MAETIDVQILDLPYKLSHEPDEKALLLECVALVDARMRQIKQSGKVQSVDRIAVMAALTLAREMLSATAAPGAGITTADIKGRLRDMIAIADQALAPQEKLFD